jgi:hypothetical protein
MDPAGVFLMCVARSGSAFDGSFSLAAEIRRLPVLELDGAVFMVERGDVVLGGRDIEASKELLAGGSGLGGKSLTLFQLRRCRLRRDERSGVVLVLRA